MPKTNNIGISPSGPAKSLTALTAIYKVSSSLTPFSSEEIISYTQYNGI